MTDKERGVLNELVLMLEPSESIETTGEFSSQQVLPLEAGVVGSGHILRASNDELMEPGEFSSPEVLARKVRRIPRPDIDPRREVKAGLGFDRASEEEMKERLTVEIRRRGTAFPHGKDPGFPRAQADELKARNILKICRKADAGGLVGTPHVAVVFAHAPREATRGAEGLAAGLQRKEKAIQKRRLRKLSRIKRAGEYWKKGPPTQETSRASNTKERHQIRTLARVLRTSDPKLRTKIKYNNNGGKTEGVSTLGGVMSLKICMYSTRREKMKLGTLATKRASKQGQNIRLSARRMKANSEYKDWWKRLITSKRNWKRKSLKGSTDVYLLKRTIELEID
jgi:hypothetical protein